MKGQELKDPKDLTIAEKKKILTRLLISDMIPLNAPEETKAPMKSILRGMREDLKNIYDAYKTDRDDPYLGYLFEIFNPCPCWAMISSYKDKIFSKI